MDYTNMFIVVGEVVRIGKTMEVDGIGFKKSILTIKTLKNDTNNYVDIALYNDLVDALNNVEIGKIVGVRGYLTKSILADDTPGSKTEVVANTMTILSKGDE